MNKTNCLWILVLMMVTGACWAYGGGSSSSKACDKPKFSNFVPTENTEVAAGSAFSFAASKNTYPTTIKVNVKEQPAIIKINTKNDGTFQVNGRLPASVKGAYARISITADAQSNCKGTGGWLVKITD
jgi:hypothetical protein